MCPGVKLLDLRDPPLSSSPALVMSLYHYGFCFSFSYVGSLLATHMQPDDNIVCPLLLHQRLSLMKPLKIPCLFPKSTAAHHYVSSDVQQGVFVYVFAHELC